MASSPSLLFRISVVLLPVSLVLYLASLAMDVAEVIQTTTILGMSRETVTGYRLLTTIRDLWREGEMVLVVAITAFTIVFPVGKYVALLYVLLGRARRRVVLAWVKNLGQWSMGDVFVVAFLVVMLRINTGPLTVRVSSEPGLYVFAASVVTSMIVSVLLAVHEDRRLRSAAPPTSD